jgi:hypothetical protein
VNVQAALSLIVRGIIGRIVVVVIAVMVVVVTIMVMVMAMMVVIMAMVNMVQIAIRMRVKENVRENAGRRPICHADDRRQRKHEHHRPDQGNAASARSFQSRQHPFRYQPSGGSSAPLGRRVTGHKPASLSRETLNLEANAEAPSRFVRPRLSGARSPPLVSVVRS